MRELVTELAGQQLTLRATFGAAQEVADKIADPLAIAREAGVEAMMMGRGLVYEPRWKFTIKNVPHIIHIGLKAAGDSRSLADVEELAFEAGFIVARDLAIEYLLLISGPKPEEVKPSGKTSGN